ncbi:MAG: glycosyltransferase [Blastocatellia bacterium]|nr:glycosyltransferase [Blastocatellia bacterium]
METRILSGQNKLLMVTDAPTRTDGPQPALQLDEDFGVDTKLWFRFLSRRASLSNDDRVTLSAVWILLCDSKRPGKISTTLEAIKEAKLKVRDILITADENFSDTLQTILANAEPSDLIWFMNAGDSLDQNAIGLVAEAEAAHADLCLFDTYFVENGRAFPQLHPGFNRAFGLNCDYFRSRFLARVEAIRRTINNAVPENAYLVARALIAASHRDEHIRGIHLPHVFMRIEENLDRLAQDARSLVDNATESDFSARSTDYSTEFNQTVSVIICTQDKGHLLKQLIRNILDTAENLIREILIVSHNTSNLYALKTLSELKDCPRVRVIPYEGPFNFSRQCNLAAREASGKHLLFLNDDVTPVTRDWLLQLVLPLQNPEIGLTGPLLLYPDETVQHAGMFLGYRGVAGHTLRAARLPSGDYLFMTQAPREVSCLTGAVLTIDRQLFEDLNGYDPLLGTYLQDVDLCLRAKRLGRRLIFNPRSVLLHMESTTIRDSLADPLMQNVRERERYHFVRRWGADVRRDPFYNPNMDLQVENLRSLLAEPRDISQ